MVSGETKACEIKTIVRRQFWLAFFLVFPFCSQAQAVSIEQIKRESQCASWNDLRKLYVEQDQALEATYQAQRLYQRFCQESQP